jgi:hypothetical protein
MDARALILVEGISDLLAVRALARRRARDLERERISVVPIGGAHAITRYVELFGPRGLGIELVGLCDVGEEHWFRRALGPDGYEVCVADLEAELIRSLGAERVEELVASQRDLGSFRTLQKQPEWRGRPREEQLRRFFGSGGSRKIRYARVLVDALDLDAVPAPLDAVLARV